MVNRNPTRKTSSLFPDPHLAGEDGIVALGANLYPETLLEAYSKGIFPWPMEGWPLPWFCPAERGVLFFKDLHIAQSLKRLKKKTSWRVSIDEDFKGVIQACRDTHETRASGTWITPEFVKAYSEMHQLGYAHSLEVWDQKELVGGIYGVEVKGCFNAESMFHLKPNASKLALWGLVEHLQTCGFEWMDVQEVTPITKSFGAKSISRKAYLKLLDQSQTSSQRFTPKKD